MGTSDFCWEAIATQEFPSFFGQRRRCGRPHRRTQGFRHLLSASVNMTLGFIDATAQA
jgi:hypothetical protein